MLGVWRLQEPTILAAPRRVRSVSCAEEDDLLTGEELSCSARFNFLFVDRPDLLYSVKELMRKMASPRTVDLIALKRVARHTVTY